MSSNAMPSPSSSRNVRNCAFTLSRTCCDAHNVSFSHAFREIMLTTGSGADTAMFPMGFTAVKRTAGSTSLPIVINAGNTREDTSGSFNDPACGRISNIKRENSESEPFCRISSQEGSSPSTQDAPLVPRASLRYCSATLLVCYTNTSLNRILVTDLIPVQRQAIAQQRKMGLLPSLFAEGHIHDDFP